MSTPLHNCGTDNTGTVQQCHTGTVNTRQSKCTSRKFYAVSYSIISISTVKIFCQKYDLSAELWWCTQGFLLTTGHHSLQLINVQLQPSSPQQSTALSTVSGRLLRSSLRHRQSSMTVLHIIACWPYSAIDVAHLVVEHSQLPDPLSGTCLQTKSETLTAPHLHSGSYWQHSSSTSITQLRDI